MRRRLAIAGTVVVSALTAVAAQTRRPATPQAPTFICGDDQVIAAPLPLTPAAVILAGDGRLFTPCPNSPAPPSPHPAAHREMRERALLDAAAASPNADLRRLAAQANGRLGRRVTAAAPTAEPANVRREMAYAVGFGAAAESSALITNWLKTETDDDVVRLLLESVGRLRYADAAARNQAESVLVSAATGVNATRTLGGVKGLESLLRQDPRREIQLVTRARLRELTVTPGSDPRLRRLALQALTTARDDDAATIGRAATDPDWQVRRLAALRLDLARADHMAAAARLENDAAWQVRYDYMAAEGRQASATKSCASLRRRLTDSETANVLRAIDLLAASCATATDASQVVADLVARAKAPMPPAAWHVPARALTSLARLAPDEARPLLVRARTDATWQVRVAAATAAGLLADDATLQTLAADAHANVQNAALEAMGRRVSPTLFAAARRALTSSDYQLVRTAATVLRGVPADQRGETTTALTTALTRLTAEGTDTSRDPRVAILARLEEMLPESSVFVPYLADYDPAVRTAAASAYLKVSGSAAAPPANPRQRYPAQPTAEELASLPTRAVIVMEGGGQMVMTLHVSQAPVTIARFVRLARAGHYDGLTFHRVVPNFVVQGGSPGASEYVGDTRYLRDETGPELHLRGAVGISTRGKDTGDAQIFIDLVDVPRLDHDYTVFGQVTSGLDVLDRILEGARIQRVTFGGQ